MALLSHLRRRTSSGRFLPEIDSLRFVAIAAVVFYHIAGFLAETDGPGFAARSAESWVYRLASHGNSGVPLFFVISGFILGLPFASYWLADGNRPSLSAYFKRRLTRLEPPYVLSMVTFAAVLVMLHRASAAEILPHLAASLLYLHGAIFGTISTVNGVAWSLEVEIQFYLLVPILTLLYAVRPSLLRRGLFVGSIALGFGLASFIGSGRMHLMLPAFLQFFLTGMLLADCYVSRARPWPTVAALRNPWIATIGGMCYTIYLIHFPIISFVGHRTLPLGRSLGPVGHLAVQSILLVPIVLVVSAICFALIERPCMDPEWPQHLGQWIRARVGVGRPAVLDIARERTGR